eukprot:6020201-Amphidinium_carterae.1
MKASVRRDQFHMVAEQSSSVMTSRLVQSAIIDDIKIWVYNPSLDNINMLQAHNTKLPLPTGFDGTSSSPPFLEWADEIRIYINLYSIDIQYEMDQAISVSDVIHTSDIITESIKKDSTYSQQFHHQLKVTQRKWINSMKTSTPDPGVSTMPATSSITSSFIPPRENPTFWSDDPSGHHQDWRHGDSFTPSVLVVIVIDRFNYFKGFFILS